MSDSPLTRITGERERLQTWLDDIQLSARTGFPTYANPGELRDDLRWLLAALTEAEAENERLRHGIEQVLRIGCSLEVLRPLLDQPATHSDERQQSEGDAPTSPPSPDGQSGGDGL